MIIQRKTYAEIAHIWPGMYGAVWGYAPDSRPPDFVYLVLEDDESALIGFAAVNILKDREVIISWGAALPEHRGRARNVLALKEIVYRLHQDGIKWIQVHVKNDNSAMLKLALHLKFRVFGLHRSTDGIFYVELIKEAEDGS